MEPALVPVNAAMFPEPDKPIPIVLLEFVQFTVAVTGVGLKLIAVVFAPAHIVWLDTAGTEGIGLTVMLKFCGAPVQPLKVGVATKFPEIDTEPALVPTNEAMFPEPDAPIPILVFEFVQSIEEAGGLTVKLMAVVLSPLQTV